MVAKGDCDSISDEEGVWAIFEKCRKVKPLMGKVNKGVLWVRWRVCNIPKINTQFLKSQGYFLRLKFFIFKYRAPLFNISVGLFMSKVQFLRSSISFYKNQYRGFSESSFWFLLTYFLIKNQRSTPTFLLFSPPISFFKIWANHFQD